MISPSQMMLLDDRKFILSKSDNTPVGPSEQIVREEIRKLNDNAEEIKKLKEQIEKKEKEDKERQKSSE